MFTKGILSFRGQSATLVRVLAAFLVAVTAVAGVPVLASASSVNPAAVGGFVWVDQNLNGVQDPTDDGITGVEVFLYDAAGLVIDGPATTDANGYYFFRTVKPGAYPWRNHVNNWRAAHIHFSVFGPSFSHRLITQLYFEGDPLIPLCPIVQTIPDPDAIEQLIATLDMNATIPLDTIAYKFDIVLRGRRSTYFENRPEGN